VIRRGRFGGGGEACVLRFDGSVVNEATFLGIIFFHTFLKCCL